MRKSECTESGEALLVTSFLSGCGKFFFLREGFLTFGYSMVDGELDEKNKTAEIDDDGRDQVRNLGAIH